MGGVDAVVLRLERSAGQLDSSVGELFEHGSRCGRGFDVRVGCTSQSSGCGAGEGGCRGSGEKLSA